MFQQLKKMYVVLYSNNSRHRREQLQTQSWAAKSLILALKLLREPPLGIILDLRGGHSHENPLELAQGQKPVCSVM